MHSLLKSLHLIDLFTYHAPLCNALDSDEVLVMEQDIELELAQVRIMYRLNSASSCVTGYH